MSYDIKIKRQIELTQDQVIKSLSWEKIWILIHQNLSLSKDKPSIFQYVLQSHWQISHSPSLCAIKCNCFYQVWVGEHDLAWIEPDDEEEVKFLVLKRRLSWGGHVNSKSVWQERKYKKTRKKKKIHRRVPRERSYTVKVSKNMRTKFRKD